jgi:hypothetical protein
MKKIKITESQLKMIMERRHSFVAQETDESVEMEQNEEEECDECWSKNEEESEEPTEEPINESVEKIKASFKRFF